MVDFDAWAQADNERIVLIQLSPWTGSAAESKYMGSQYYYDGTNEYEDRVKNDLVIRRSLAGAFTGRGEANVGAMTFDNADRALDDWLTYAWQGRDVTILYGDPSWNIGDFETVFKGLTENAEGDDTTITIFTRDLMDKLDRPIVERPINMHPQSFGEPFPLSLGTPKNVTPPIGQQIPTNNEGYYICGLWGHGAAGGKTVYSAVYENGKETGKSLNDRYSVGGGEIAFRFDVNDPEGTVTADLNPPEDTPMRADGDDLTKPGEILEYLLSYEMNRESGIARGGSTTTIVLDDNATHTDDFYNAAGTVNDNSDQGYVAVFRRNSDEAEDGEVSDQTGDTITLSSALSFAVEEGDRYDIVPPSTIRYGALESSEIDTDSLDALPAYNLGIWDGRGGMTYLELLDDIFPGGSWYYWTRASTLKVGLLEAPGTSSLTIDTDETHDEIIHVQEDAPIYRARVGYDRNWTVMKSPDETVDVARASFLAREYLWELDEDLTVRDAYPEAKPKDFPSYLIDKADAETEAERLMTLFGTARRRIGVNTFAAPFTIDLHDTVTLKDANYGLSSGVDYRVVGITEFPLQGRCELELWG